MAMLNNQRVAKLPDLFCCGMFSFRIFPLLSAQELQHIAKKPQMLKKPFWNSRNHKVKKLESQKAKKPQATKAAQVRKQINKEKNYKWTRDDSSIIVLKDNH
jgi:hypothetical protein